MIRQYVPFLVNHFVQYLVKIENQVGDCIALVSEWSTGSYHFHLMADPKGCQLSNSLPAHDFTLVPWRQFAAPDPAVVSNVQVKLVDLMRGHPAAVVLDYNLMPLIFDPPLPS